MKKTIGIVGGVGPYAGIEIVKRIYDQTIGSSDQDHISVAMLAEPEKISDRTEYLLGKNATNPGIQIANVINKLHETGADIIGIPCNTAHSPKIFNSILEHLKYKGNFELVHMIEEVVKIIKFELPQRKRIGVLATTGTLNSKLYFNKLAEYDLTNIQLDDSDQEQYVQSSIYNSKYGIKAFSNPITERAKKYLELACDLLIKRGAEVIILGCTELSLAFDIEEYRGCKIIDSTTVLARKLIEKAAPEKLKSQE